MAYNRSISAFEEESFWQKTWFLLQQLRSNHLKLTVISYNAAMNVGVTSATSAWMEILNLAERLRVQGQRWTLLTENAIIQALTKNHRWHLAVSLKNDTMISIAPDVLTYHFGIAAFEKGQQSLPSIRLMEQLECKAAVDLMEKDTQGRCGDWGDDRSSFVFMFCWLYHVESC